MMSYFGRKDSRVLYVGGAGFDPRSTTFARLLAASGGRISAVLLREERPDPDENLVLSANRNEAELAGLLPEHTVVPVRVFGDDDAVILGRSVVRSLESIPLDGVGDVVIDLSALSIGASFPVTKYFSERWQSRGQPRNLHLVVAGHSELDELIVPVATETVVSPHGFRGGLGIDENQDAAKLWMPQLTGRKRSALARIRDSLRPHDIAPILPFPARNPRLADELIDLCAEELEEGWGVDARNLVYAAESNPLDLYRTILRIDEERRPVFAEVGGSLLVLSPVGTKVLAVGALMAALERDLPILYVEATGYELDLGRSGRPSYDELDLVHVWLYGDAYLRD